MTLQNRLKAVGDALVEVTSKAYHYEKPASVKAPYIVWREEGGDNFGADNRNAEVSADGTIDVYSKTEFDSLFDSIPDALNGVALCRLNSIQYEDTTKLIHYEYRFWV